MLRIGALVLAGLLPLSVILVTARLISIHGAAAVWRNRQARNGLLASFGISVACFAGFVWLVAYSHRG